MKKGARLFGGIDMEIKHIQDHLMSVEEGYVRCFLIEGENAALVIDGGGLVPQQIVNAHTKIIRDPPQRVIVRLTDALCVVAQRGRTKAQLGCKVFELDFLAIN